MNKLTYKQFYEHLKVLLSKKQASLEEVIAYVKTTQIVDNAVKEVKPDANRK